MFQLYKLRVSTVREPSDPSTPVRGWRRLALKDLARCSQCGAVVPSAEVVDVDGRGATCMSCRGEDDDGSSAGADAQGSLTGMPTGPPGDGIHSIEYLQEMVDLRRSYFAAQELMFDDPRAGTAALESIPPTSRVMIRPQPIGSMASADAWKRAGSRLEMFSAALSLGAPLPIDAPTLNALGCTNPAMLQDLLDELAGGTIPSDAESFQTFTANLRAAVAASHMGRGWRGSLQAAARASLQAVLPGMRRTLTPQDVRALPNGDGRCPKESP